MYYSGTAKVIKETPKGLYLEFYAPGVFIQNPADRYDVDGVYECEMRIDDGRTITAEQRKKAYATINDIAQWNGDPPEALKEWLKYDFICKTGQNKYFSLSDCSVTTAREFITFILDFALEHGVPLEDTLINRTDDIDAALYSALIRKRCIVCGDDAELHHVDAIKIGHNRETVNHLGRRVMALCRKHHSEAHSIGQNTFNDKYKVYGIVADERICRAYKLNKE